MPSSTPRRARVHHLLTNLLTAAAVLVTCLLGSSTAAADDGVGDLSVRKARLSMAKAGRQRALVKGQIDFAGLGATGNPAVDLLRVSVGDVAVFELAERGDRDGLKALSHGRYRFRDRTVPGRRATRLALDLSTGKFVLDARGLDLTDLVAAGPGEVPITIELGDGVFETTATFRAGRKRWLYKSRRSVSPPPGGGGPGGGDPGGGGPGGGVPDGAVAFTPIASGQFSGIAFEETVVVRDQAAWNQLWSRHGSGVQPSVDFSRDMVVGAFLGDRANAAWDTSITGVVASSGRYTVSYVESETAGSCAIAQVITQPFALGTVRRTSGTVSFSKLRAIAICHGNPGQ